MASEPCSLAIETSARTGSVSLGRGDRIVQTAALPQQRRHAIDLMPAIDRLCRDASIGPSDLTEVCVSIGPGSFTGLRIGLTTAKMLTFATGCDLYGIGTLDVVAQNAPKDTDRTLAVCLNAKRGDCYSGLYRFVDGRWIPESEPALRTPQQLIKAAGGPLMVIGDQLPPFDWPEQAERLDPDLAIPRSEVLWHLGRQRAADHEPDDAMALSPCYVRLPEAEEVWRQKQESA